MSILEGLIKPTLKTDISPIINTNVDMSSETNITYNIDKLEIKIDRVDIKLDERALMRLIEANSLQRQQRPAVESPDNTSH